MRAKTREKFQKLLKRLKPLDSLFKGTWEQRTKHQYNTQAQVVNEITKRKVLSAVAHNFHLSSLSRLSKLSKPK